MYTLTPSGYVASLTTLPGYFPGCHEKTDESSSEFSTKG